MKKYFFLDDLNNVCRMTLWNIIFLAKPDVVVLFHYYNITTFLTQNTCVIVLIVLPCVAD